MEKTDTQIHGVKELGRYVELANEASQAGLYCYLAGGVPSSLLSDALSLQIGDAAEALRLSLNAAKNDPENAEGIVRFYFFRFGIYRGFIKRSSGALQKNRGQK